MGGALGALYPISFQATQTPAHFALVAALAGQPWHLRNDLVVADLGCGRGYAAQVMAAANPGWIVFGLDHDPAALAEAREVAARAGLANLTFVEADLGAMDARLLELLPAFDVVTAHGLWTWVEEPVQAGMVRLLARRLKPGGLAYLGYNALPAAGGDAALQRLLHHLARGEGGVAGAERAVAALRGFAARDALPLPRTAMLARLLADPPALDPAFVAHEFLTTDWRPVFHEDLCEALAAARLDFLGSVNLHEALPVVVAESTQRAAVAALPEGPAREFAKDLVLPRPFRADLFVRGRRRTDPVPLLDRLVLAARGPLPAHSPALNLGTGRATLPEAIWAPIAGALSDGPRPIGALRALAPAGLKPHPGEVAALLVDAGLALPVFRAPAPDASATRFNRAAAEYHAPRSGGRGHFALAAPAAAGGLPVDALDLALAARLPGFAATEGGGADGKRLAERAPAWRRFGVW